MNLIERLRVLDTCAVSDALDALGLPGATTGLRPLWSSATTVVGRARTVLAGEKRDDGSAVHLASPVVASAESNDVVVIANGGRLDVSCWGGILALAAIQAGVRGVVVDGACRDIDDSEALQLPVFGRTVVPVSARGRVVQRAMDIPVHIAGVTVDTGDLVVADANGVVFVPAARADDVVVIAERIAEREAAMAGAVRAGRGIVDVMHDAAFPTAGGDGNA